MGELLNIKVQTITNGYAVDIEGHDPKLYFSPEKMVRGIIKLCKLKVNAAKVKDADAEQLKAKLCKWVEEAHRHEQLSKERYRQISEANRKVRDLKLEIAELKRQIRKQSKN